MPPEATYCIYKVLDLIREKPGMYCGAKSIVRLHVYLGGYDHAMCDLGFNQECSPEFSFSFDDWVAARLGYYETTAGWCNMILAQTKGWSPKRKWRTLAQSGTPSEEALAVARFYELLDDYRRGDMP